MTVLKNARVKSILDFIDQFGICTAEHIAKLYYKNYGNPSHALVKARDKMYRLFQEKTVKRKRSDINSKYYYFSDKEPVQIHHRLCMIDLYVSLVELFGQDNVDMQIHYNQINGMVPDALIRIIKTDLIYYFFLEVHLSNNPFNYEKYEKVYYSKDYENIYPSEAKIKNPILPFPKVIVMTDKKLKIESKLRFIVTDLALNNLEDLLGISNRNVLNAY